LPLINTDDTDRKDFGIQFPAIFGNLGISGNFFLGFLLSSAFQRFAVAISDVPMSGFPDDPILALPVTILVITPPLKVPVKTR
jgi:hypothetical protein